MDFKTKTGLVLELEKRVKGRRYPENDPKTPRGISLLLGISYQAVRAKLDDNYFTVQEAFLIQRTLFPDLALDYLFEEQTL